MLAAFMPPIAGILFPAAGLDFATFGFFGYWAPPIWNSELLLLL